MYYSSFGLTRVPFSPTPDPGFLYLSENGRDVMARLVQALLHQKGMAMLTGEAGSGKTMLLWTLLANVSSDVMQSAFVLNPALTPEELLETILCEFGVKEIPPSKPARLTLLRNTLLKAAHDKKVAALVIDDAHVLSAATLEEVRLLGNLETGSQKLLQIALCGLPELENNVGTGPHQSLRQRIAVPLTLASMSRTDIESLLASRWQKAGANRPLPFTTSAIDEVASFSRGLPRLAVMIAEACLQAAFVSRTEQVTASLVEAVCATLRIGQDEGVVAQRRAAAALTSDDEDLPVAARNGQAEDGVGSPAASRLSRVRMQFKFGRQKQED